MSSAVPGRKLWVGPKAGDFGECQKSEIITYTLSPEEITARYGPVNPRPDKKASPLAKMSDPELMDNKKAMKGKGNGK